MKKTKLIRGAIMAVFVLLALLLVYTVVRQTMPDIIPLLQSGDEEALEAYLERDMSFTGHLPDLLVAGARHQLYGLPASGQVSR